MILTHYVNKIVDMPDDGGDGRVAIAPSVGAQEGVAEIDAHYAAAVADRPQLPIGQVARLRAQGVGIEWVATSGAVEWWAVSQKPVHSCAKHRSASSGRWHGR